MVEKDTAPLPAEPTPAPMGPEAPSSDDKLWAAVAYLTQIFVPILVPAVLLLSEENKRRPFQKYHAVHALTLLAISVIYEVVAFIVYSVVGAITAGCLYCLLWPVFFLPVVVFVHYAYQAYQGRRFEVPYVTQFLREQGWL